MFCCTLLNVHSSIAIILMGKRELVALLNLSSWCLVMVERLFLAVPRGCLQFVIVVFPDHTHLLFLLHQKVDELYHKIISLNIKITSEEIESVTKRESAIWRTYCLKLILKSESVKLYLFLHFRILFLCLPTDRLLRLRISKREKTSNSGI